MRRQVGICIELKHDRSIFLMKNGRIVKGTPVGNPSIGEETSFYPLEKKPANRWQPILAPLVAATTAIMLFMSALVFPTEEAFGYVQVQINPGIELGINDQYEVVSIRELNNDGYDLIHQLGDWEGESLHAVLNRVFDLAVTEQTTQVTVTAIEEDGSKLDQSVKKVVMAVSSDVKNQEFAIQMKEATKKQWRESKENQVPVGHMIKKAEILKVQKPSQVQESEKEVPLLPAPIENKARIEQIKQSNSKEENSNSEKSVNTPAADKKAVPPAVEKKSISPAAETKKDDRPAKSEAQQSNQKQNNQKQGSQKQNNQKQNNKNEAPSTKPQKAPIKEQEKGKPTKSAPKEKPAVKKEKNQPEKKEKSQPEKKEKSQPEKKEKSQPEKKEKSQPEKKEKSQLEKKENNQPEKEKQGNGEAPGQQKKNDTPAARSDSSNKEKSQKSPESIQPDQSKKNERQKLERKENIPAQENKQGKKEKE